MTRDPRDPRDLAPAVFLDKDGTLIEDLPYNVDPARIRLAPGVRAGLPALHAAGYLLVVATNQSGVARGYFTERDLAAIRDHLEAMCAAMGAPLAGFHWCPHLPPPEGINEYAVECDCRKPEPGLILRAAEEHAIDLGRSWFVGDAWMDVAAGRRAGCRTVMVGPEWETAADLQPEVRPDFAVPDLAAAAGIILHEDGRAPGPDGPPGPDARPAPTRARSSGRGPHRTGVPA